MRRYLLTLVVLIAATLFAAPAQAADVVVPLHSDTFVRSDQPTTNFGSVDPLQVDGIVAGNPAEPERRSLLYFPNTPDRVIAAKLRVHVRFHTGQPFQVRKVTCQGWTAATVTYNTQPTLGDVIATFTDDPLGNVEADLPADQITAGSNCFALTKSGSNWMTLSSKESQNPAKLLVTTDDTPEPTPTPTPEPESPVAHCSGTPVDVTPSTISSVLNSRDDVVVNAAPGTYGSLSVYPSTGKSCVEIRCTVAAKSGDFARNTSGCTSTQQWIFGAIRNLTIERFSFVTGDDYGVQLYDENPNVGMKTRIAENVFNGNMYHDISTKNRNLYTEVLDNYFISCMRHCWEIGQNGNIPSRPSTTDTSIFRGNKVSSRIQGVTQRYNKTLLVENNEFRNVAGYAVITEPFWDPYLGQLNMIPEGPLRTNVTGNSFSSGNRLFFTGRGSADDVVLLQGNTGATPACARGGMNSRDSSTSAAHSNVQTLAPPQLDPASDMPC